MKQSMRALSRGVRIMCLVIIGLGAAISAQAATAFDQSARSPFREPVVLASQGSLLEVELSAHQGKRFRTIPSS
jgi:hypothetical protein